MGYLIKPVDMTEEAQNKLRNQALKAAKGTKVEYEIICPNCQAIRVLIEKENCSSFINVLCLACGQVNIVIIKDNKIYYESEEEKAKHSGRNARRRLNWKLKVL